MFQVKALDTFDVTDFAGDTFRLTESDTPDAVLVRSTKVPDELISEHLLLVARSGIGTNTINVDACTENGTAVFNTPGANANAVKELIIQCLFYSGRPLFSALAATRKLVADDLQAAAEGIRKSYVGEELYGKTVGILGLGAIGQRLANTCYHLGMQVLGYNRSFKNLQHVQQMEDINDVLEQADFVVLLLPLNDETEHMMGKAQFRLMKDTAFLLNFGRAALVDDDAVKEALHQRQFAHYITDFPQNDLKDEPQITMLPHLGGNTVEALSNSANLTLQNTLDFLEAGTIRSSVNFPPVDLPFTSPYRFTLFFKTRNNFWSDVSDVLNHFELPMQEMMGNTRGDYGYTVVNTTIPEMNQDQDQVETILSALSNVPGMIRVRLLANPSDFIETPIPPESI
ncbi:3-phosphoglycerate dehydrogenase [Secundilactobacillus paracollinoides]|uniref:3-phosphoglycerate dehydrogenase n=1 Tax=Secundilactobacillus paracollinoides TaxID=240427 RepID=A0A1B2IY90_9LACO|nr:NAD(P)-dependent oxidoreductase [Secundilactobacillus paracollinoides]ANZ61084.1 3-phosphoglycerate dehydrogenase [Secundilactobacillus paracollinoides]ANZ64492.1 3-phosphoglycerate dehydrogenase [Secundilactobacillus paracollinoides]ANZ67007.1 3-phosphoglycerate dehydrogenase [Secundilactobacillus paracollinoides]KRL78136.1 phosphoglycerate dehydrogenase [Secundilactobacillus paracollinoides DSM 15502 = JCM 11969]